MQNPKRLFVPLKFKPKKEKPKKEVKPQKGKKKEVDTEEYLELLAVGIDLNFGYLKSFK